MYYLNLLKKPLQIFEYYPGDYDPETETSDYDWKVWASEDEAHDWLEKYETILNGLDNKLICNSRELPNMLYKRRYMVQTLMGEKLQTYRHYLKTWKPGDLINLYDQTYFLTVELTEIEALPEGQYCYHFRLPV